jgi:hypothetical protein
LTTGNYTGIGDINPLPDSSVVRPDSHSKSFVSATDLPSWKAKYLRACRTMNAQERIIRHLRGDLLKTVSKIAELESMLADLGTKSVDLYEIMTAPWFQNATVKEFAMELIRNLGTAPNRRRCSPESDTISYFLYCCSAKGYCFESTWNASSRKHVWPSPNEV